MPTAAIAAGKLAVLVVCVCLHLYMLDIRLSVTVLTPASRVQEMTGPGLVFLSDVILDYNIVCVSHFRCCTMCAVAIGYQPMVARL